MSYLIIIDTIDLILDVIIHVILFIHQFGICLQVSKVEILPQGSITLVRVTANDLAAERKALESLVLLPEIHDSAVKLEVVIAR